MAVLAEYMCAALRHQLDRSERSIHEDVGGTKDALAPQDEDASSLRMRASLEGEEVL
jgi:hypothetical protein